LVDGELVRAPIEKGPLEFVVNTNWNVFFDKTTSRYYLRNERQWLTAPALEGPWMVTTKLPKAMSDLPAQPNWADAKKVIPPASYGGNAPTVFYSNTLAEIIAFRGQPKFAPIPDTALAYATNTENDVFLHSGEKQYYFLVAGRWFRAKSREGPWIYADADLPADSALIPPDSTRSRVLASVPGRTRARATLFFRGVE